MINKKKKKTKPETGGDTNQTPFVNRLIIAFYLKHYLNRQDLLGRWTRVILGGTQFPVVPVTQFKYTPLPPPMQKVCRPAKGPQGGAFAPAAPAWILSRWEYDASL